MDKRLKHLNALRCFESAARHQSYSKAAEELFVSQAAVSQQMRQLEESLNIKLFVRRGRRMQLTQAGEKLFQSTHSALNTLIQGLNSVQVEEVAGDLTVTSTQSFCSLWVLPRLYRFSQLYPDINIKILGSSQYEDLRAEHIDLAIRFTVNKRMKHAGNLYIEQFGEDAVYPVCSPNLLQHMDINKPEDLMKCNLVSFANNTMMTWQKWFENAGVVDSNIPLQETLVSSSDMALSAVLSGHGVALASSAFICRYIESNQLIVPFNISHPHQWQRYFVYDLDSPRLARIKKFADWIKAEFSDYTPPISSRKNNYVDV